MKQVFLHKKKKKQGFFFNNKEWTNDSLFWIWINKLNYSINHGLSKLYFGQNISSHTEKIQSDTILKLNII
jgi:hypothetical protein